MKKKIVIVIALAVSCLLLLAGCGGSKSDNSQSAADQSANLNNQNGGGTGNGRQRNGTNGFGGNFAPFESAYLTDTYDSALSTSMQLELGTLKLEDGNNKVTPDQAKKLLPLWQSLQNGSTQSASERNAVYQSIENTMTADQMNEIANMKLTYTAMSNWAQANGIQLPQGFGQGSFGQGGANGQGDPFGNMSQDERTKLRDELQNMTPEQRQARLQELGINMPQGGQSGQGTQNGQRLGGRNSFLLDPLVKLLTDRAAQ